MQITDVRVRKVAKEGKLKAVVSITMDEEFVVHDIKVIEGEKGLFIATASRSCDGNIEILHIRSIQEQESAFRISSLRNMKKHWQRMQQKHRWYMYRRKEQEFPAPFLNVVCQNKLSAVCLKMSYDSYFLSVKITQDHLLTENA